ncbi:MULTISPECIES: hypothetical protein [Cytobacillus]|nr:hypothetical protein [Cytobacillus kochii]
MARGILKVYSAKQALKSLVNNIDNEEEFDIGRICGLNNSTRYL